jgi:hypothetical protein
MRDTLKVAEVSDGLVLEAVAEQFSDEYQHGYRLREIVRQHNGKWLAIWERRLETYAADFDWSPPAEKAREDASHD